MSPPVSPHDLTPGWTILDLLNHLWQSTAVALAVLILILLCRQIPARTRRVLCWLALGKFAVPFTLFSAFRLPVGPLGHWLLGTDGQTGASTPASLAVASAPLDAPGTAGIAAAAAPVDPGHLIDWTPAGWLSAIWLTGAAIVIGSWIMRAIFARRQILARTEPLAPEVEKQLDEAAWEVGLEAVPNGLAVDADYAPAVVGLFAPVVILPRGIETELSRDELRSVLLHEMVHIQRQDSVWAAVQALVVGVLWFNPVVWLICQRLYMESEQSCDERVLEMTGDPQAYAGGILKCVRRALGLPQPVYPSVANPPVASRIEAILSHGSKPERRLARRLAVAVALGLGSVGGLAGTFAASIPNSNPRSPGPSASVAAPATPAPVVTVDFPDTSTRVIIDSVAQLFRLNIVFPAGAPTGMVSVKLRNVTWRQIFKTILEPEGFTFVEDGSNVRVLPIASRAGWTPGGGNFSLSAQRAIPDSPDAPDAVSIAWRPDDTLDIEFQDIEARTVIAAVADTYDLNVVIPDAVRGRASLNLSGVTWRQVFKSVLDPVGFTFVEEGTILKIVPKPKEQIADELRAAELAAATAQRATAQRAVIQAGAANRRSPAAAADGEILDPSKLDRIPMIVTQAAPRLPDDFRRPYAGGTVTVEFVVDSNGDVPTAWATKSTAGEFEPYAVETVKAWKFEPGRKSGQQVATHMVVDIVFNASASLPTTSGVIAVRPIEVPTGILDRGTTQGPATPAYATYTGTGAVAVDALASGATIGSIKKPATSAPTALVSTGSPTSLIVTAAATRRAQAGVTEYLAKDGREIVAINEDGVIRIPAEVYQAARVDKKPEVKVQVKPDYPIAMRRQGVAGTVKVGFIVDKSGVVAAAWAIKSTSPEFERNATAAVARWRFLPAKAAGEPVATAMVVDLVFNLNDRL